MRVTLIHNPGAGDGIATADALRGMLEDAGYRVRVVSTDGKWRTALKRGADLVVASGGDGTVRKVALATAGSGVPIAVLPFGTANNVGKTLGVVGFAREIIARWRDAEPRPMDLGVARIAGRERRFVESAGGGLFADLIRRGATAVEGAPVFVGRETDRALMLLADRALDATAEAWGVEIDGRDASGRYVGVEVLNVRFAGPNVPLAPLADPGDGQLDVALLDDDARDRLAAYAGERLRMSAARIPGVRVERGTHVVLRPPPGAALHVDDRLVRPGRKAGDDAPTDRTVELTLEPAAVRVVGEPDAPEG